MTIKSLIEYAEKRGYYFNGIKTYNGFYIADKFDGSTVKSDTLMGLKRMIDKY